jgi:propanol-preferring alcohol dehydrogenase
MGIMKAARLHAIGENLSIDSVPVPHPGSEEVLVKVGAAGICHSDVNYREGIAPVARLPLTMGHEIAGSIAEKGAGVSDIGIGDRVCVDLL